MPINDNNFRQAEHALIDGVYVRPEHLLTKAGRPSAALRKFASARNVVSQERGWLYRQVGQDTRPICQGWRDYAKRYALPIIASTDPYQPTEESLRTRGELKRYALKRAGENKVQAVRRQVG
jgi:hypothetical protein